LASARKTPKSKYTVDRNIPGAFEGETITRRRMMTLTAHGAGAAAAMAFTLPVLGFALGTPLFERPKAIWTPVGRPEEFPDDTYIPKAVTMVHGVGEIGKTTAYVRAHNEAIDGAVSKLPKDLDGQVVPFVAMSTRCMHLGCPVRYVDAAKRFICPCHGGVYDFTGHPSGGPPVRPLDRFYTRIRNGQLEVGPRYSVNGEFKRFPSYRDPGEDLDGIGQFLYPGRFSTPKR
jgi:menaquinol-cytochrome c reductase iron-sulfur subunit